MVLVGTADDAVTFDKVTIGANTVLLLVPYNNGNTNYTDDAPFTLNANDIVIDEGGSISSDAQGYSAAETLATGHGPGGGETSNTDSPCFSGKGGGYGNTGGASIASASGGSAYGSNTEPTDLGSAGGAGACYAVPFVTAGNGGGAIKLVVDDTLTINGTISADGGEAKGIWYDSTWNGCRRRRFGRQSVAESWDGDRKRCHPCQRR